MAAITEDSVQTLSIQVVPTPSDPLAKRANLVAHIERAKEFAVKTAKTTADDDQIRMFEAYLEELGKPHVNQTVIWAIEEAMRCHV